MTHLSLYPSLRIGLTKLNMSDCKPKPTRCVLGTEKVSNVKSPILSDPKIYREIVGSL